MDALVSVYRSLISKYQQEQKATGSTGGRGEDNNLGVKGEGDHDLSEGTIRGVEEARHDMRGKDRHDFVGS
jgi:hypothetical protein